jgi:gas vesicle protein
MRKNADHDADKEDKADKADKAESVESESQSSGSHGAGIAGAIALAAVIGLGVGLLAAPQAGDRTRKALRKRLAAFGEDLEEGFEELEEKSRPVRKQIRERAARLRDQGGKAWEELDDRLDRLETRDDDSSSGLVSVLTFAAGLAATYFLTSEQAGPTRAKVRDAANTLRQRATDRWDRFQERRSANGGGAEGRAQTEPQTGGAGDI